MITISNKHNRIAPRSWYEINPTHTADHVDFTLYYAHINDTIYEEWSEEFEDAFNKARLWDKLSDRQV